MGPEERVIGIPNLELVDQKFKLPRSATGISLVGVSPYPVGSDAVSG